MKTIAFAPVKGGTGCTTAAVSLAHGLALAGHDVVLVDSDPRGDASAHFGLPEAPGLEALFEGRPARAFLVREGLRVLPCRSELRGDSEAMLSRLLETFRDADVVVFDLPHDASRFATAVLARADLCIAPCAADALGLRALAAALPELATRVARGTLCVLPNFDAPEAAWREAIWNDLRAAAGTHFLLTPIRSAEALRAGAALQGTVFEIESFGAAAGDLAQLTEEVRALVL